MITEQKKTAVSLLYWRFSNSLQPQEPIKEERDKNWKWEKKNGKWSERGLMRERVVGVGGGEEETLIACPPRLDVEVIRRGRSSDNYKGGG